MSYLQGSGPWSLSTRLRARHPGCMSSAEAYPDLPIPDAAAPPERSRSLEAAECFALLDTDCLGRVVYTRDALPAITPVNYKMSGHHIMIRTAAGSGIAQAARAQSVVAF